MNMEMMLKMAEDEEGYIITAGPSQAMIEQAVAMETIEFSFTGVALGRRFHLAKQIQAFIDEAAAQPNPRAEMDSSSIKMFGRTLTAARSCRDEA